MLKKSAAQVLFVSTDYLNVAHKILADGWEGQVLLIGTGRDGIEGTEGLIRQSSATDPIHTTIDDEAIL